MQHATGCGVLAVCCAAASHSIETTAKTAATSLSNPQNSSSWLTVLYARVVHKLGVYSILSQQRPQLHHNLQAKTANSKPDETHAVCTNFV
jgi:hypothetical protein